MGHWGRVDRRRRAGRSEGGQEEAAGRERDGREGKGEKGKQSRILIDLWCGEKAGTWEGEKG